MSTRASETLDAVIIGAGFAGLFSLHRLRDQLGLKVRAFDAADDVGGTWYWNRYPGARCDIESYWYSYSFDEDLQQEWTWSEHFAAQPEILRYLNHVADRFDLRRDIQFGARVNSAVFNEDSRRWTVETSDGNCVEAQFLISGLGNLSLPRKPDFSGLSDFTGEVYWTGKWPKEPVDFTGKRVAIVGTGASAIQAIPLIAEQAAHLTVFQRTADYATPLQNRPLTPAESDAIKANYPELRREQREAYAGIPYHLEFETRQRALDDSAEERERIFEARYAAGSFRLPFGSYLDVLTDLEANELAAEYVRRKVRERINDPENAEMLAASGYPYGARRTPMETNYYETYNRDNVELINAKKTPILGATGNGLKTQEREFEVDAIVMAIGFDAMSGPLMNIDIRGRDGQTIQEKWQAGPLTYLGIATEGFPNLFIITGPQSPSVWYNMPSAIEDHVEFTTQCIAYMNEHGFVTCDATVEAERDWVAHAKEESDKTIVPLGKSYYMGTNIPGKPETCMVYTGGAPKYRGICADVVAKRYAGFAFDEVPFEDAHSPSSAVVER
jgi:cyclohexanone monooxygenase